MKELVVVAIGGNSIIKDNASQSIEHQAEAVKAVADTVLEMLACYALMCCFCFNICFQ